MAASHRSVRGARGLGYHAALPASNVVGARVWSPKQHSESRDPSQGPSDWTSPTWILVRKVEEGGEFLLGLCSDSTLHSCPGLH